jgi:hypothetical protein
MTATGPGMLDELRLALAYPARRGVFAMLGVYAVGGLFATLFRVQFAVEWLPRFALSGSTQGLPGFFLGVLLDLLLALLALKIAIEALANTALRPAGEHDVGEKPATDTNAGVHLIVLGLAAALAYATALWAGYAAAGLVLYALALVLPASLMLLGAYENAWRALNPWAWRALVGRLGTGAYFGLVIRIAALALAAVALQLALHAVLPLVLASPPARLIGLYAVVAAYHAMGRLLMHNQQALGLEVAQPIVRPKYASYEEGTVMQEADDLVAADQPAAAADALFALVRRAGASAPVHDRLRALLLQTQDLPRRAAHDREYVANLLALGQEQRALSIVTDARVHDPAFVLEDPASITRLVAYAAKAGHSRLGVDLAADFATRFPKSDDIVRNGLVVANLLADRLGRDADARALLESLLRDRPDDPQAPEVRAALASLAAAPGVNQIP